MSDAYGDEPWNDPCEECIRLEDLVGAVRKIAKANVYEGGEKANGISVELIAAISEASKIAEGAP